MPGISRDQTFGQYRERVAGTPKDLPALGGTLAQLREVHRPAQGSESLGIFALPRTGAAELRPRWYLRSAAALASMSLLVVLWCMTHHYLGLAGDARLYGVQALARIRPNLFEDLYLRNTSQDSYTIFSGFYAVCIRFLGLRSAALWLTIIFKVWLFAAAWVLARRLSDRRGAL